MFGHDTDPAATWRSEIQTDATRLDTACRAYLGVSAVMFRTVKFLFHIATLLFTVYLIEATTFDTSLAVFVAVLLIAGPEGLEAMLVRQGYLTDRGE